jgi:formylglycine-generating enzyme required for sulfatase activity
MKKQLYFIMLIGLCAACSYPELSLEEFNDLTLGIEMVQVQGGTFTMGPTSDQISGYDFTGSYSDEFPTHSVTLSSFQIGKYEVTQKQWWDVMGSWTSDPDHQPNATYGKGDNYPMYSVSHNQIQSFLTALNQRTGKNYRLPTEAEWEYAAKGGQKSRNYEFSGSNTIGNVAWYRDNIPSQSQGTTGYGTHPVGTKAPNELGIYDMTGNVSEWCSDWFDVYSSASQTNPTGATSGTKRVYRGGNWISSTADSHVSLRTYHEPNYYSVVWGFRLVLPL